MNKIFFLNSWGESSAALLQRYSRQTPNISGIWKDIVGVPKIKDADYCVVLGMGQHRRADFDLDKTIYVKREPTFIARDSDAFKHTILWKDTHCGITWWVNKTYDELKSMEYPNKTKKISCVVSSKHSHRNNYVRSLFRGDSPIELYGRGHDSGYYGAHYKGQLNYNGKCKLRGLIDYEYSIVLENCQQKNYWTEKLADAYLSWNIPLYWGCPNISDYFPANSYHLLDMKIPNPIDQIKEIIKQPIDIEALTKARNMVLDEHNLWAVINRKIKTL